MAQGNWRFPNETIVPNTSSNSIYSSRGPSSVNLHNLHSSMTPTGIYTCEIPGINGTHKSLDVHLYDRQFPGKLY